MGNRPFLSFDHVQLAMPPGREPEARAFYAGQLGLEEVEKPEDLRARGGAWFASGPVRLHLGVEPGFRASAKAHAGLCCADFEGLVARLSGAGVEVVRAGAFEDGAQHAYVNDPFGNRIELVSVAAPAFEGVDHVDARVRDLGSVRAFYDGFMPALGLTFVAEGTSAVEYCEPAGGVSPRRFFGVNEDRSHVPSSTRVAFRVTSREEVDRVVRAAAEAGARDLEGPENLDGRSTYYAAFFSDPEGNALEVCFRSGTSIVAPV